MVTHRVRVALLSAVVFLAPAASIAQQAGVISGVVRDATTSRPLTGAAVTLAGAGEDRTTQSDERGAFFFVKIKPGTYQVTARRIGYSPWRGEVEVKASGALVNFALERLATLDTVRVPVGTAIYGVVGTARELKPLRGAAIQVAGMNAAVRTDSTGRFFTALKNPGTYVVRTHIEGYESQAMSVTVRKDEAVEVSLLLDPASGRTSHQDEVAWKEFDDRQRERGARSALVSRAELMTHGNVGLLEALQRAQSVGENGLNVGPGACVFVDGQLAQAQAIWSLDAAAVEAVEVYTSSGAMSNSDLSGTLAFRSQGTRCGGSGRTRTSGPEVVKWVVIWMKK
jgi:hypothetical protein